MGGRAGDIVFWCIELSILGAVILLTYFCGRRRFRPSLAILGTSGAGKTRLFYALRDGHVVSTVRSPRESTFTGYLALIGSEAEIRDIPSYRISDLCIQELKRVSVVLVCLGRESYHDAFAFLLKLAIAGRSVGLVGGHDFLEEAVEEFRRYTEAELVGTSRNEVDSILSHFVLLRAELSDEDETWDATEVMQFLYKEL